MTLGATLTYRDAIDHAVDFLGGGNDARNKNNVYAAVQAAYRDVGYRRAWKYLQRFERVTTVAPYSTGTVEYDHTGGANERQVTLTTGTWPMWAADGWIVLDSVEYEVESRVSGSIITLTEEANPGADVAAGETYTIYQDTYRLSDTVARILAPPEHESYYGLGYITLQEWVALRKRTSSTQGVPTHFALGPDPSAKGFWSMFFWPVPSAAATIDLMCHHRPRRMTISGEAADDYTGTVTSSSTTVTGSGTTFGAQHVGCILRTSYDATDPPTGPNGRKPFQYEREVKSRASATSLTIDTSTTISSGVKFVLSDPVDLHESLWNFFFRAIERQLATRMSRKDMPNVDALYRQAYIEACEADAVMVPDWDYPGGWRSRVIDTTG